MQASFTVIYAFVHFLTIGARAFAILGEASSSSLRATTTALPTATQAVFGIVMNTAIAYMINRDQANLKGKVGFIFGGLALLATLGSFFSVPEVKGRAFYKIDTIFLNHVPPRGMGSYVVGPQDL